MSCPYIGQKSFWAVQIVLEGYKLFLVGPIRFGQIQKILDEVQIRLFFIIIWFYPKCIRLAQNDLYQSKIISDISYRRTRKK